MTHSIATNLTQFTEALNQGQRIEANRQGKWYTENGFVRFIRWLFGFKDARVVKVATAFNRCLDQLERTPVTFEVDPVYGLSSDRSFYQKYVNAANAVEDRLKTCNTARAKQKLNELRLRVTALQYRIIADIALTEKAESIGPDQQDYEELKALAQAWKNGYDNYLDKTLDPKEEEKLKIACRYPQFTRVLKDDRKLQEFFFKWALRDNNEVKPFVLFPATVQRLKDAYISGRIGKFSSLLHLLEVKKNDGPQEIKMLDFVLPFEVVEEGRLVVKDVSILDDAKEVTMNKNYRVTVGKILKTFANKNDGPGDFEMLGPRFLPDGRKLTPRIANYNTLKKGAYDPSSGTYEKPDFTKKDWIKDLPPSDILSRAQVLRLCGLKEEELVEGAWVIPACGSRESPTLEVSFSHGYNMVLVPRDGEYALYTFGAYANEDDWPRSLLDKFGFVTNTMIAEIASPDENYFYSQRQQAISPNVVTEEQGRVFLEELRKDLLDAEKKRLVFQFPWENCAWRTQNLLERTLGPERIGGPVPQYFKSHILTSEPQTQPLPMIYSFCRKFAGKVQEVIIRIIEFMIGGWRGITFIERGKRVRKSVVKSGHYKNFQIFNPSMLHKRIADGKIRGVVTFGHMNLVQAN